MLDLDAFEKKLLLCYLEQNFEGMNDFEMGVKPQDTWWEYSQSDEDAFMMHFVEKYLKIAIVHADMIWLWSF